MALTDGRLMGYLRDSLHIDENLDANSELFSNGLLDSMAMMQLIAFVEETSGVEVRPDHVTLENFDTPARILRFTSSQL